MPLARQRLAHDLRVVLLIIDDQHGRFDDL